jgi:hypothetical protein
MTIWELEKVIREREEILLFVRGPVAAKVGEFHYERAAWGSMSITEWLQKRVYPCTGQYEVVVVDGHLNTPHGRTKLSTLRDTYDR